MKRRFMILALTTLAVVALISVVSPVVTSPANADGAVQISGDGVFAEPGECNDSGGAGSDFAIKLTGDFQGCFYVFVDTWKCTPSGTYIETGRDFFVVDYAGEGSGTFWTTYRFEAKYTDCPNLIGEVFGRCQHPINADKPRTGIFSNVTGRVDIKDDVDGETITFHYRGHLKGL